jgi:protein-tyrosine phosphatase
MIDIHTHVLAGLDDGACSLEEGVAMLRIAAESGTTDLVATPHANLQFRFDPAAIDARLSELSLAAGNAVRLHRGCDFHLYFDNIQDALAHPAKYTINGGSYLLVEFPDVLIANTTDEVFHRLLQAGMIPIITHPERNFLLHRRMEQMAGWVAAGCLIQVTAQSFLGRFGSEARNVARELMRRDMVHFVASDAHDAEDRTPSLREAYRHVSNKYGAARAERLFIHNPGAVIRSAPLPIVAEPPETPAKPWYRFW